MTDAAYAACLQLAERHYENFPVASRLLPAPMRPHIAAVYAFARTADDLADEGDRAPDDRLAALDAYRRRLHAAVSGANDDDPAIVAAAGTIASCDLPIALFDDLVSAFAQDVTVSRYDTWDALLDYCRRSANPVGRLVLGIAADRDAHRARLSDAVCTALQLTNFWQDLERDWAKGRVYVPLAILRTHGAAPDDLAARRITPAWRAALADVAARTRALFREGRGVADGLPARLRWELRATWLGGRRVLDRLEAGGFDVFASRPTLGWRDLAGIAAGVARWRSATSGERAAA